jgi:hypothetical protein
MRRANLDVTFVKTNSRRAYAPPKQAQSQYRRALASAVALTLKEEVDAHVIAEEHSYILQVHVANIHCPKPGHQEFTPLKCDVTFHACSPFTTRSDLASRSYLIPNSLFR